MHNIDVSRIRQVVGLTGLTQKDFCNRNNLSENSMRAWINSPVENLTLKSAKKICDAADNCGVEVSKLWLMEGLGEPPTLKYKKLVNDDILTNPATDSSQQLITNALNYYENADREISEFARHMFGGVTLHISDRSMEPFYRKGDYVGGRIVKKIDMDKSLNRNCIIKLVGHDMLCRQLIQTEQQYYLLAYNRDERIPYKVIANPTIEFIAPIIRVWHI